MSSSFHNTSFYFHYHNCSIIENSIIIIVKINIRVKLFLLLFVSFLLLHLHTAAVPKDFHSPPMLFHKTNLFHAPRKSYPQFVDNLLITLGFFHNFHRKYWFYADINVHNPFPQLVSNVHNPLFSTHYPHNPYFLYPYCVEITYFLIYIYFF